MAEDTRLPRATLDVIENRLADFRKLYPEAFAGERIDLKKLRQALGGACTNQMWQGTF